MQHSSFMAQVYEVGMIDPPEHVNTKASKMILDVLNMAMLHNSARSLRHSNNGLYVEAKWVGLGDSQPRLTISVIGLSPLNWLGPQPGFLPNTNAAPKDKPYSGMVCSDCGSVMVSESGCLICKYCGFTRCG